MNDFDKYSVIKGLNKRGLKYKISYFSVNFVKTVAKKAILSKILIIFQKIIIFFNPLITTSPASARGGVRLQRER